MRIYFYRGNLLKVLAASAVVLLIVLVVWVCGIGSQSPPETATPAPTVASNPTAALEQPPRETSDPAVTPLPSEGQALYRAIWRGTIDEVRALVAGGTDVDANGDDREPLLYTAVWRAEPEKCRS